MPSVPSIASGILSKSLAIAKMQVQELAPSIGSARYTNYDSLSDSPDSPGGGILPQAERMQRMFTFHGHALVVSLFLKTEEAFPTGLPSRLVVSIFDFGLDLLSESVVTAPLATRNITCSLVRAGSLIVSSCLHLGYVRLSVSES